MPWIASQVVDLQVNCFTHEVQWQKNSCHRKCCGSVVAMSVVTTTTKESSIEKRYIWCSYTVVSCVLAWYGRLYASIGKNSRHTRSSDRKTPITESVVGPIVVVVVMEYLTCDWQSKSCGVGVSGGVVAAVSHSEDDSVPVLLVFHWVSVPGEHRPWWARSAAASGSQAWCWQDEDEVNFWIFSASQLEAKTYGTYWWCQAAITVFLPLNRAVKNNFLLDPFILGRKDN